MRRSGTPGTGSPGVRFEPSALFSSPRHARLRGEPDERLAFPQRRAAFMSGGRRRLLVRPLSKFVDEAVEFPDSPVDPPDHGDDLVDLGTFGDHVRAMDTDGLAQRGERLLDFVLRTHRSCPKPLSV